MSNELNPASPLPKLEVYGEDGGYIAIIEAGSFTQRTDGVYRANWIAQVEIDNAEIDEGEARHRAAYICEACNAYPALQAETKRLREALEFYANKSNYEEGRPIFDCGDEWVDDNGERAREALEGKD
jgi:hypothetical protein